MKKDGFTQLNAKASRLKTGNLTACPAEPRQSRGFTPLNAKSSGQYGRNLTGFTLIELLVVIVIIGIIATFSVIIINQARAKARDAQRLSDIKQISTALELYRADEESYPTVLTPGQSLVGPTSGVIYVKTLPTNPPPTNDGSCTVNEYAYLTSDGGETYQITYCLGGATGSAAAGTNVARPYVIASSCTPNCTNKCTGEADGCDGTCANAVVAYEGGPYDSNGTTQATGGYYRTVLIGAQCWLKDNLNVGTMIGSKLADNTTVQNQTNTGTIEKYCYTYVQQGNAGQITTGTADCAVYGGFYQWPEAVQYSNGVTLTSGTAVAGGNIQGICPTGWHLPSSTEFATLSTYLGGDSVSGTVIKETGMVYWNYGSPGTNTSGFTALGAGRCTSGNFDSRGVVAYFSSTLAQGTNNAYWRRPHYATATFTNSYSSRSDGYSVRCLRD